MIPNLKSDAVKSRNLADAHKRIYQAGGDFGNVMMSRLEREHGNGCKHVADMMMRRLR